MKYSYIFLILSLTIICCACGITKSNNSDKGEPVSGSVEINPLVPDTEVTIETMAEHTQELFDAVVDSYSILQELANSDNASKKGKKAADKIISEYGTRIDELSKTDFTKMTKDELNDYMTEMSNILTIIREARDILTSE